MLNVGDTLGGIYEITEKIGSGGGGIIFKANHLRMKKSVAVKLIKDNVKGILENRAEVDLLKNLKNEYLPQVLDFVEDNNDVYTVMEFIEGENFKQLISSGKTYDKKAVQKYAVQLCEAVEYLHSQNPPIIHSDIKPANIMLTPEDKICLIDFNISSVSDGSGAYSVGGSAGYAAPEQFKKIIDVPVEVDEFREETRFIEYEDDVTEIIDEDDATEIIDEDDVTEFVGMNGGSIGDNNSAKPDNLHTNSAVSPSSVIIKHVGKAYIDTRTDIYGIGASLHYIITGRRPVDGKTDFRGIQISRKMQRIIEKAMAPNPAHRYRSVSEMKKDIENNGTLKINIKSAIAASVAVVLIAATAIIYPIVHVKLKTSATIYSLGSEFVIEKTDKREILGGKISDKYNATAVSLMEQLYNYYSTLSLDEHLYYIKAGSEAEAIIKEQLPDTEIRYSDLYVSGSKLDPSTDKLYEYLYNNFTNYTDCDELYISFEGNAGQINYMYVSDDPNLASEVFNTDNGIIRGNLGVAETIAVNDTKLSNADMSMLNDNIEALIRATDISFLGEKYALSTEEIDSTGSNLYNEDLSSLAKLQFLKDINFTEAKGVDISAFPVCQSVESISFKSSDIISLECIAEKFPNLKTLDISYTSISDLSPLSESNNLENLNCYFCKKISDLSPLANISGFKSLDIGLCKSVKSLSGISSIDSLERLDISSCTFEDDSFINVILQFKNLKSLDLTGVSHTGGRFGIGWITDLNGFENLTKLEELNLTYARITDITPIVNLPELKTLNLDGITSFYDFSPIQNMTKLEDLVLMSKHELDASIFKNLTNLKKLEINMSEGSNNKYPYIDSSELMTYISKMKLLEELKLRYIKFSDSDIDALCELKSLTALSLYSDISAEASKKIKNALPNCNTYIYVYEFETYDYYDEEEPVGIDDDVYEDYETEPVGNAMDSDFILSAYYNFKGVVALSDNSGDEKADKFAEMMSFKMVFPGNIPFTDGFHSEFIKPVEDNPDFVVCTLRYDQSDSENCTGYVYSLAEAGYNVKYVEGYWRVYDDNENQIILISNCSDYFDVEFGGIVADSDSLF